MSKHFYIEIISYIIAATRTDWDNKFSIQRNIAIDKEGFFVSKSITIVGDKFTEFAKNEMVILISDMENLAMKGGLQNSDTYYELGQGVSEKRINNLIKISEAQNARKKLLFDHVVKCSREHVHKESPENSMITVPVSVSGNIFESSMYIDDNNELMCDHLTGQHLQGMLLTEASRQMFLAVTEEYFPHESGEIMSFAWKRGDVHFLNYTFPISTKIIFTILNMDTNKKTRQAYSSKIDFIQKGVITCTALMEYEVLGIKVTKRRETLLAAASVA